jgi:hypothetical protein
MSNDDQKLILSAALMNGLGMHLGAWMARDGEGAGHEPLSIRYPQDRDEIAGHRPNEG